MFDTDKYEGHSPAPWLRDSNDVHTNDGLRSIADVVILGDGDKLYRECVANARLIADAPLLLVEVKRLHEWLDKQNNTCPRCFESIAWGCENNKGGRDKDIRHCISCDYDSPYQTEMKNNR